MKTYGAYPASLEQRNWTKIRLYSSRTVTRMNWNRGPRIEYFFSLFNSSEELELIIGTQQRLKMTIFVLVSLMWHSHYNLIFSHPFPAFFLCTFSEEKNPFPPFYFSQNFQHLARRLNKLRLQARQMQISLLNEIPLTKRFDKLNYKLDLFVKNRH